MSGRARILLFLWAALILRASDPNFSGTWRLIEERGQAAAPGSVLRIEHEAGTIRCTTLDSNAAWSWIIDGKEHRNAVGRAGWKTILKWEGSVLLVNTLVSGPQGDYARMERWRLSRDGSTLTIRSQVVRRTGESEGVLVYQRQEQQLRLAARPADPAPVPSAPAPEPAAEPASYRLEPGTRIPLVLVNSISTKHSAEGDRVYLETAFPILAGGRVVVPPGSYVAGTLTRVTRPGRAKGRAELFLRFDSLTLPNGVTRDFRSRLDAIDGETAGDFDRAEGKIGGEGNKGGDARTVGEATAAGASVGTIAGAATGHYGMGTLIGAGAGAAAGLAGVLGSRGPEAVLPKGSTLEMVLDRLLSFTEEELNFGGFRRVP